MQIKTITVVLLIALILAACVPAAGIAPTQTAVPMADNFAFVLYDKPCEVNILDTTSGTLVHTPSSGGTPVTISLQLNPNELEVIYQKALAIDFFSLPVKIVPPDNAKTMMYTPYGMYKLSITNGEMTNSVAWTSNITTHPLFREAVNFMELVKFIRDIIKSHPEFKQLPEATEACA